MEFEKKCLNLGESDDNMEFICGHVLAGVGMLEFARIAFESCERRLVPLIEKLERRFGQHPSDWPKSGA
jgi:hypothetical protein